MEYTNNLIYELTQYFSKQTNDTIGESIISTVGNIPDLDKLINKLKSLWDIANADGLDFFSVKFLLTGENPPHDLIYSYLINDDNKFRANLMLRFVDGYEEIKL